MLSSTATTVGVTDTRRGPSTSERQDDVSNEGKEGRKKKKYSYSYFFLSFFPLLFLLSSFLSFFLILLFAFKFSWVAYAMPWRLDHRFPHQRIARPARRTCITRDGSASTKDKGTPLFHFFIPLLLLPIVLVFFIFFGLFFFHLFFV